jgi:hypothetical protein
VTRPPQRDDEGWGPPTAVYSSAAGAGAAAARPARPATRSPASRSERRDAFYPGTAARPATADDEWSPAGPRPAREQRAAHATDRRTERAVRALQDRTAERGLVWWAALLVLIGVAGLGGLIDTLGSISVKGGFNVGIVVASIIAILAVKRSHMFPIVIAPPIVYSAAAFLQLYIRRSTASGGTSKRQVVYDAAANYLVYGFPAIAIASAAVLIIAGFRMITRK